LNEVSVSEEGVSGAVATEENISNGSRLVWGICGWIRTQEPDSLR
jgi:hypothetical protein